MNGRQTRQGIFFALAAYFLWGITPVYFRLLDHVATRDMLAHRIIWSFFFMLILLSISGNWPQVYRAGKKGNHMLLLAITALLIAGNWLLFLWAINHQRMLETSLGYFISPMVSVLFGMLFFGERFRRLQWLAIALTCAGVLVQLWQFGSLPVIALGLAISFALYGLLRKKIGIDVQTGLLIETLWLLPLAGLYLLIFADNSASMSVYSWNLNVLLVLSGAVTTIPLLFFASAANCLRLSTLGFFQYLHPTLIFLLAVMFYNEAVSSSKILTFVFIWVALAVLALDAFYARRQLKFKRKTNAMPS